MDILNDIGEHPTCFWDENLIVVGNGLSEVPLIQNIGDKGMLIQNESGLKPFETLAIIFPGPYESQRDVSVLQNNPVRSLTKWLSV